MLRALVVLCLAVPLVAQAATPTQRAKEEAERYLARCPATPSDEHDLCINHQKEFVWDYVSAMSGNFEDQKNVAFILNDGSGGAVMRDTLQACAWNLFFLVSGDSRIGRVDADSAKEVCAPLDEAGRHMAAVRASRIERDIHLTPAKPLPDSANPFFATDVKRGRDGRPCPLDGTAYPLDGKDHPSPSGPPGCD